MKKSLFVAAMLLGAMTMSAAPYQHSIGITAGGLNGIEYKGFVTDHFVITADLGVALSQTKGYTVSGSFLSSDLQKYAQDHEDDFSVIKTQSFNNYGVVSWSFEGAANFAYQGTIKDFSAGSLQWFAGGGVSLGMAQYVYWDNDAIHPSTHDIWKAMKDERKAYKDSPDAEKEFGSKNPYWFKFGVNAYAGMEFAFSNVPLVLGFDFRPGVGVGMKTWTVGDVIYEKDGKMAVEKDAKLLQGVGYFDWTLGVTLRYCL